MSTIYVKEFDSLYQMDAYIACKGQSDLFQQARDRFFAMLRTALLLDHKIVLFQANVFDGMFFLLTGPDQIREALGIPSYHALPMEILVQTTDLDDLKVFVNQSATSAQFAMGLSRPEFGFLYDYPYGLGFESERDFQVWLQQAQEKWLEAIKQGQMTIKNFNLVGRSFPFRQVLLDYLSQEPKITPSILSTMMDLYSQSPYEFVKQSDQRSERLAKKSATLKDLVDCIQANDVLIERRWEIVMRLSALPIDLQDKKSLFIQWNTLYLRAISRQHKINFLSFDFNNNPNYESHLARVGLSVNRKMSRMEKRTILKIQGSIIEAMLKLGPSTYYELLGAMRQGQNLPINERLTNLALTLEKTGVSYIDYGEFKEKIVRSFVLLLPPSLILILSEIRVLPMKGAFQWVWMASVFMLGLPWNEISGLLQLEQSKLSGQYIIQQ